MEQTEARGRGGAAVGLLPLLLPLAYLPWLALEYLGRPLGSFDEPLLYVGARAMRHGAWPNIDFASVYPALNYAPVAASFALLGETALAARAAQVAAYWLLLAALAAWFVSLGARGVRLAALISASLGLSVALPIQTSVFGVTLGLLTLLAYLRGLAVLPGPARAALMGCAGLCAGLAAFTRPSFGLYAATALGADQALALWRARASGTHARRAVLADAAPLLTGGALVLIAILCAYGAHVHDILEQTVTVLLRALDRYAYAAAALDPSPRGIVRFLTRGWWLLVLPLGWLGWRATCRHARTCAWVGVVVLLAAELGLAAVRPAALPVLVLPVAGALVYFGARRDELERREFVALLASCLFAHYYLSRTDLAHQLPSTAPLVLLLPSALLPSALPAKALRLEAHPSRRWSAGVLVAFALALAWPSFWSSRPTPSGVRAGLALIAERSSSSDAARLAQPEPPPALVAIYPDPIENAIARAVREKTRDAEPVYVGVSDHSSSLISNLRVIWLIGRPLGARHYMLLGEISNSLKAQRHIVSDLETRDVRWAVTWRAPDDGWATLARPLEPGPSLVDDYLSSRYRPAAEFGDFTLLERVP